MQFPKYKYGLTFRLVEEGDAQFILSLRLDQKLSRYLSPTDDNLEKQIQWIRLYKAREAEGKEYYILFEDQKGQQLGIVRLYDFTRDTFNSGSWLIKSNCDDFVAIKSDLFVSTFAIEELKFKKCFFDVRIENKKVVRYHKMFSTQISEDENTLYLMMDKEAYKRKYNYLMSIIEPEL